jgi:hypothetical protein
MSEYVPEPMTEHPHYTGMAMALRDMLAQKAGDVVVPELRPLAVAYFDQPSEKQTSDALIRRRTLTRKKCAGPAPATIDPRWEQAVYVWDVLVDDIGRHVAGPARLEIGSSLR